MFKIRASSLAEIMTDPKSDKDTLSVGAKTFLKTIAKEHSYDYVELISGKYLDKGNIVEDESIALYNDVFFTGHKKNAERKENEWIGGTCDIFTGSKIIDIKSSWSLPTFPALRDDALKSAKAAGYDWQVRAYMMLWDVDCSEIAYCMVNTPDELIKYEDESLHYVDHIDPSMRVTRVEIERSKLLEQKIIFKVEEARKYLAQQVELIRWEHST